MVNRDLRKEEKEKTKEYPPQITAMANEILEIIKSEAEDIKCPEDIKNLKEIFDAVLKENPLFFDLSDEIVEEMKKRLLEIAYSFIIESTFIEIEELPMDIDKEKENIEKILRKTVILRKELFGDLPEEIEKIIQQSQISDEDYITIWLWVKTLEFKKEKSTQVNIKTWNGQNQEGFEKILKKTSSLDNWGYRLIRSS